MTTLSHFPIGAKVSLRKYFLKMGAPKPSSYVGVVTNHEGEYLIVDAPACGKALGLGTSLIILLPSEVSLAKGFAVMSPAKQAEIASRGGKSVPANKRTFSTNRDLAAGAGKLGGKSRN